MAKLNSKKWKKSLFYEEKSLVGLTPGQYFLYRIAAVLTKKVLTNRFEKI